jgi:hypothetical protein
VNCIAPVARTRLTEALAGGFMDAQEGDFDRFAPENAAAMAVWLAGPDSSGITGQVFAVGGGKAQLLGGWRPVTEVAATDVWDLDSLTAAREALTGGRDTGVPPFMPPLDG